MDFITGCYPRQCIQVFLAMQDSSQVVLVYFNFRGVAHSIRILLTYLEVPYINVHLDSLEQHQGQISEGLMNKLKKIEVDKFKLPVLLHEGRQIDTPVPIFEYLCMRFDKEELLGNTIQQRAIVTQIMELYLVFFYQTMPRLFETIMKIGSFSPQTFSQSLEGLFNECFNELGLLGEIYRYLKVNKEQESFILGNLTLPDFAFVNTATMVVGIFGGLSPDLASEESKELHKGYRASSDTIERLNRLRAYDDYFKNQPFYLNKKDEFESYPVLGMFMNEKQRESVRRVWNSDKSVLK